MLSFSGAAQSKDEVKPQWVRSGQDHFKYFTHSTAPNTSHVKALLRLVGDSTHFEMVLKNEKYCSKRSHKGAALATRELHVNGQAVSFEVRCYGNWVNVAPTTEKDKEFVLKALNVNADNNVNIVSRNKAKADVVYTFPTLNFKGFLGELKQAVKETS